jgi:hypothetical protein
MYVNFHSETKGTGESVLGNEVLGEVELWEQMQPAISLHDKWVRGVGNVPEYSCRYSPLASMSYKKNTLNKIQLMTSIKTATCFDTGVPFSGCEF